MRFAVVGLVVLSLVAVMAAQQHSPAKHNSANTVAASADKTAAATTPTTQKTYTLTILVEGVNDKPGNIGVLVFSSKSLKGWPEDRFAALRDVVVPAHPGEVTVTIPNLEPGEYGVALIHDVNMNHKLDRNFLGMPKEQWGMSNNPHATIKAPPFSKAEFAINGNTEIKVQLQ
jgi:uncharacterized protein (DUF2141 family)